MARGLGVGGIPLGLKQIAIDTWSWLNYKPIFSDPNLGIPNRRAFPEARASWVPASEERRLAAYKVLAAYDNNQAGELAEIRDGASARERREFGDPSMFIDTLVSHVLGREQHISVPGAEQDAQEGGGRAVAERVQELLREWAKHELLSMRLLQAERKAVSLGDAVIVSYWDAGKRRPRLSVFDPGFYFPVLGEDADGVDFPDRVHLAWNLEEDPRRGLKERVRRITYELGPIQPLTASGVDRHGREVRAPVLASPEGDVEGVPAPVLSRGDQSDAQGRISRLYPWNDEPSYVTCYLTDATWELGDLKAGVDVDSLPMDRARFATSPAGEVLDHLDLMIDFVPVLHLPNTVPQAGEHWGQSSLAKPLQVFDELAGTDTDSSRASATTGQPIISISGRPAGKDRGTMQMAPGMMIELGENGRMDVLNTAAQLAELRNHRADLADQAANVARLPAVSLGTMDPSKVPSGYALELSLGPLDSMVGAMRLARAHKDDLLLKFVQRLFIAGQHPDWAGLSVQPAELMRGPYTPTDKNAVLTQVTTAYTAHVVSLETAVRMLMDAGWPIEDAQQEIDQIQSREFEAARALADATGDSGAVGDFLGLDLNPDPAPPVVQLPPVPGQNTDPQPPNPGPNTGPGGGQGSGGNG
ncbi:MULTISPECIES: hypothetical protein [unclassified Streptomyces]|uniref:hypothetical protein n=1 Tax=unclassified Streptomyces TaxID=2593676 RepID=UPI0033D44B37